MESKNESSLSLFQKICLVTFGVVFFAVFLWLFIR